MPLDCAAGGEEHRGGETEVTDALQAVIHRGVVKPRDLCRDDDHYIAGPSVWQTWRDTGLTAMLDTRNMRSARQRQIRSLLNIENMTWENSKRFLANNGFRKNSTSLLFLLFFILTFLHKTTRLRTFPTMPTQDTITVTTPEIQKLMFWTEISKLVSNLSVINKSSKWPKMSDAWLRHVYLSEISFWVWVGPGDLVI